MQDPAADVGFSFRKRLGPKNVSDLDSDVRSVVKEFMAVAIEHAFEQEGLRTELGKKWSSEADGAKPRKDGGSTKDINERRVDALARRPGTMTRLNEVFVHIHETLRKLRKEEPLGNVSPKDKLGAVTEADFLEVMRAHGSMPPRQFKLLYRRFGANASLDLEDFRPLSFRELAAELQPRVPRARQGRKRAHMFFF